jgi:SAM-dependent methyltransferase
MDISKIPVITVSYNSAALIDELLGSFRRFYSNQIYIIDGSSAELYPAIEATAAKYADVKFIHFDYNIHHGPGMSWAINNLELSGPVLVLDSDVAVLKAGLIESLLDQLKPGMWGVGSVSYIDEGGYDVEYTEGAIRYLHPACMLVNIDVVRQWPMPVKHGAPMVETMTAIHKAGKPELLGHVEWVRQDFSKEETKNFIRHDWQGTVKLTGGYHLDEWEKASREAALERLTIEAYVPAQALRIVEIGGGDGALSRGIKTRLPHVHYAGIGISAGQDLSQRAHCDQALNLDVDGLDDKFFQARHDADCWILDKALERLTNPEQLLKKIRKVIGKDGCIVASIPNVQHWTLQAKLCIGDFRYADAGLMNRAHLRWFSRATIFELFEQAGFAVAQGSPVIHSKLENQTVLNAMRQFAASVGADPELAIADAMADSYIIKAIPK